MEELELSHLIGNMYDASLDPTLWPEVLQGSADFVGGVASALFIKDTVRKSHNNIYTWGYDPAYTRTYLERYVSLDPFTVGQFLFHAGDVISLADLVTHEEFRESLFYREWVQPQHWVDALGATLDKTATSYAAASVIRHERNGIVDDEARRRMQLLVPHFRRAVAIGKVIDLHKLEAAGLADTLDGLAHAVFLVDAERRLVYANRRGQELVSEEDVVRRIKGRLSAADPKANDMLSETLTAAAGGDDQLGSRGVAVPLASRTQDTSWVAHILPLTSGARLRAGASYSAVAAVFVRKAELELPHPVETFANLYNLTPAELRVLLALVEKSGVPEAAAMLGISEPTVKTHLQRIFGKTGSKRQADLVKLVAGYMNP